MRTDRIPVKLREKIMARDGYACTNCGGSDEIQVDHCLPSCLGGKSTMLNLRVLCKKCNLQRNKDLYVHRKDTIKKRVDKETKVLKEQIRKLEQTMENMKCEIKSKEDLSEFFEKQLGKTQEYLSLLMDSYAACQENFKSYVIKNACR